VIISKKTSSVLTAWPYLTLPNGEILVNLSLLTIITLIATLMISKLRLRVYRKGICDEYTI